jgi:hypothetical protein
LPVKEPREVIKEKRGSKNGGLALTSYWINAILIINIVKTLAIEELIYFWTLTVLPNSLLRILEIT